MSDRPPLRVETWAVTKRFGSFTALDDVTMKVEPGELHALLGENGAGKSTLVKCMIGYQPVDKGSVIVDGQERVFSNPRDAHALGLGMVYQHFTLVPSMTVAENLVMSRADVPMAIDWSSEFDRLPGLPPPMPVRGALRPPGGLRSGGRPPHGRRGHPRDRGAGHPGASPSLLEPLLQKLLADQESEVVLRAVAAAREMRSPALMGPLLLLLTRRAVREEARVALAAFGPAALARLGEALVDPALPHAIRRHVPGAIGMIGSAQAPELLLRHLRSEPDGMIRFKILRALGRWRNSQPDVALDGNLLQETLGQALTTGFRLKGWRRALVRGGLSAPALRTELHQILVALLLDKQDHTLERTFRLLNLQTGSEEFQRVYRGLHSPREATRAGSRELLEHLVLPQVRGPLLTLVDDLHGGPAPTEASGWQSAAGVNRAYARVLEELVECGMESVSTLAAAHAAELGFGELAAIIEACPTVSPEHRATLARAARILRGEAA